MPNNILITPGSASIQFSGSAANTIRLQVESSGSIAFYGNSGSLFGITDSLSGSLMSVNDISGLPILEVFSDDRVVMGSFNKNTLVVTGSRVGIDKAVPTADLDISGSVFITGSLRMSSGGITGSLFGTSSLATTSSYVLPSGLPTGTVSSSIQINTGSFSGSFTGILIGTSSWADNAISASFATTSSAANSITFTPSTASFSTSASYALSASYAPSAPGGGITSLIAGDGLTGGEITSTGTITLDTGSVHFLDGVKKELNTEGVVSSSSQISYTGLSNVPSGIVSSSAQVTSLLPAGTVSSSGQVSYTGLSNVPSGIVSSSTQVTTLLPAGTVSSSAQVSYTGLSNIPSGIVSSSAFTSPSQGTVRATINNIQTDVDTGLQTGDSPTFTGLSVSTSITASIISSSTITGSHVQFKGLTDTTSANKILVLDTITHKIFTTASVGGGSGNGFPYNGTVTPAVISGSLLISSSINSPLTVSGSINDFFELEIVNASAGNNASSDMVVSSNNTTDFGNYAAFGINSTTYNGGLVGGPSDGYLYLTSSVGELHLGNASTIASSNVRLFAGGPSSDNTTRMFISASGNVGIGVTTNLRNTLTVNGSVSASSVTGSVTGSFTGALTHFSPSTLKLTVGTTAPASPSVNDLWVDTN